MATKFEEGRWRGILTALVLSGVISAGVATAITLKLSRVSPRFADRFIARLAKRSLKGKMKRVLPSMGKPMSAQAGKAVGHDMSFDPFNLSEAKQEFSEKKRLHLDYSMTTVPGVEIFQTGEFTDSQGQKAEWTVAKLDQMIKNFQEGFPGVVPIKLGHTSDKFIKEVATALELPKEVLLGENQSGKGGAALGYMGGLRRYGEKLFADIQAQDQIAHLIHDKFYHNSSLEIFPDYEVDGKSIGPVISAMSLLGNERPALPLPGFAEHEQARIYYYEVHGMNPLRQPMRPVRPMMKRQQFSLDRLFIGNGLSAQVALWKSASELDAKHKDRTKFDLYMFLDKVATTFFRKGLISPGTRKRLKEEILKVSNGSGYSEAGRLTYEAGTNPEAIKKNLIARIDFARRTRPHTANWPPARWAVLLRNQVKFRVARGHITPEMGKLVVREIPGVVGSYQFSEANFQGDPTQRGQQLVDSRDRKSDMSPSNITVWDVPVHNRHLRRTEHVYVRAPNEGQAKTAIFQGLGSLLQAAGKVVGTGGGAILSLYLAKRFLIGKPKVATTAKQAAGNAAFWGGLRKLIFEEPEQQQLLSYRTKQQLVKLILKRLGVVGTAVIAGQVLAGLVAKGGSNQEFSV